MAEQDEGAGKREHAGKLLQIVLITCYKPTKILEPREPPLNFPSVTIATPRAAILRAGGAMRRDHLRTGFSAWIGAPRRDHVTLGG